MRYCCRVWYWCTRLESYIQLSIIREQIKVQTMFAYNIFQRVMYLINKIGPRTETWGTLYFSVTGVELHDPIWTVCEFVFGPWDMTAIITRNANSLSGAKTWEFATSQRDIVDDVNNGSSKAFQIDKHSLFENKITVGQALITLTYWDQDKWTHFFLHFQAKFLERKYQVINQHFIKFCSWFPMRNESAFRSWIGAQ